MEQIYICSIFRLYYLPLFSCDILDKEELLNTWIDLQFDLHGAHNRTIGKVIIKTLLPQPDWIAIFDTAA